MCAKRYIAVIVMRCGIYTQTPKLFEKLRVKLFEYLFEKKVSII